MHEDMTLLMSLTLDGEATPAEEARLQAHLAMCPTCAATWEDWRAADRLFAKAPIVAPSPDLLAGLAVRLEMVDARRQRTRWIAIAFDRGRAVVLRVDAFNGRPISWLVTPTHHRRSASFRCCCDCRRG